MREDLIILLQLIKGKHESRSPSSQLPKLPGVRSDHPARNTRGNVHSSMLVLRITRLMRKVSQNILN